MNGLKLIVLVCIIATAFFAVSAFALGNPASAYCKSLGYEYDVTTLGDGQKGFCVLPGGETCEEWEFFEGKCGKEKSWCAQQGYGIKTIKGNGPFSSEYAVCVLPGGKEVPVADAMNIKKLMACDSKPAEPQRSITLMPTMLGAKAAPAEFDWRNYSSENWMTPVKDQGYCGSCWAFSAVGTVEAKYNIGQNNSRLDPDIAEEYLVSDCHSVSGYQTCCGGWQDIALDYINNSGISDESCFPYIDGSGCNCFSGCSAGCTYRTGSNCSKTTCSDRCSDWSSRLWKLTGYGYLGSISASTVKQYLLDYGPLAVGMDVSSMNINATDGIGYCAGYDQLDHAIVLVGYNNTGNYWILKNSWGEGYEDNGYFKVRYGECNITDDVAFALNPVPPNYKPKVSLYTPASDYITNNSLIQSNFTVYTSNASNSTCKLISNKTILNSTTANNATPTILYGTLSEGINHLYVNCYEMGVPNVSDIRIIAADFTLPNINVIEPKNTTTNSDWFNFSYSEPTDWTYYIIDNSMSDNASYITGWWEIMSGLSDGSHNITVWANDSAGNSNSTIVYWTRDTLLPTLSISHPINKTYGAKWIWANVTLDTLGSWCGVSLNGTANQSLSNSTGNWNLNPTVPAEGANWVQFFCNDTAGNMNVTSPVFFTVDTVPPSVNVTSPLNNSAVHGTQNITIFVSDANLNSSTLFINGSDPSLSAAPSCVGTINATCQFPVNTTNYTDGAYVVNASANDTANNTGVSAPMFYTFDNTLPSVLIVSPVNTTYNVSIPLNFVANDTSISWCGYSLDRSSNTTLPGCTNTTLDVTNGGHNITLFANDSAGNMNSSDTLYFSFDNTIPVISNISVNTTNSTAIIAWSTDENSNTGLVYGTNASSFTNSTFNSSNITYHAVNLANLTPATAYAFQPNSTDAAGNARVADIIWFMTANTVQTQINISNVTNFTFNTTINGTATLITNLTIVTNTTLNATISVTMLSANPTSTNISAPIVLPHYVTIDTNNTLNGTVLSWVIIKFFYNSSDLPSDVDESSLRLYRYNGTAWEQLPGGVNVSEPRYVWGNSSLLSDFGIGGTIANGQTCSAASQCSGGYCCSSKCQSSACTVPSAGPSGGSPSSYSSPSTRVTVERGKANISIPSIAAGRMSNVTITKTVNETTGVRELNIYVKNAVNNVLVVITRADQQPTGTGTIAGSMVYHYLDISHENITDADVNKTVIKFGIDKTWLTQNNISRSGVRLYRWDGSWAELTTTSAGETTDEALFSADSPGLSYFAITGKVAGIAPSAIACPTCALPTDWSACMNSTQSRTNYRCSVATNYTCEAYTESQECGTTSEQMPWTTIMAVILAAGIVAFAMWKMRKS